MHAAVYLRQSLDRAADGLAVSRQREDCLALVARRGWQLAHIYEDNDVSASSGKQRPAYAELLEELRAGRIDVVVAWASDRLHRRLAELVEFLAVVNQAGALVATVNSGDVDLATPHGRMLAGILGSVAQAEVEQKGLRQQRANQQRAQAGVPRFTRRPFGYATDGVTVVDLEANVVRRSAAAETKRPPGYSRVAAPESASASTRTRERRRSASCARRRPARTQVHPLPCAR